MAVARFSYARSIAPMLWMLVGLSCVELAVVHAFVAHWWPRAALALSAVTGGGVLWLVFAIRSFTLRPVEVFDAGVLMRVGMLRTLWLPAEALAGARQEVRDGEARSRHVANLALIAYPNVVIDLAAPIVTRRRTITAVAHRLDDPAAFVRAAEALVAAR